MRRKLTGVEGEIMKKLYPLLLAALLLCTACRMEEVPAVELDTAEETMAYESGETESEAVQVRIYYCPIGTGGLEVASEEMASLTPESILTHLSRHNIVSIDTKVEKFREEQGEKEKILHLDLTKDFGEYLNTMGMQSEEIIMAALTNTFLDAYEADGIVVTVEGKTLKTTNYEYADTLRFTELDKIQSVE